VTAIQCRFPANLVVELSSIDTLAGLRLSHLPRACAAAPAQSQSSSGKEMTAYRKRDER